MVTNVYTVLNNLKNLLNTNNKLQDARITVGENSTRDWWHTDSPFAQATFPRGQVLLVDNDTEIIGQNYTEAESAMIGLVFSTKKGFYITVNGTKISDERLCHYYADLIRNTVKTNRNDISSTWGIKVSRTEKPVLDDDTNIYSIMIVLKINWFNVGTC